VDAVEDRIDAINTLKRKYGQSVPAILSYLDNAKTELERLQRSEESLSSLKSASGKRTMRSQRPARGFPRQGKQRQVTFASTLWSICAI
jgi:DNA repair ATPase RecN